MQHRATTTAIAVLALLVAVFGLLILSEQRTSSARLEELTCVERATAAATLSLMVPADQVDAAGRLESVRTLSELVDEC